MLIASSYSKFIYSFDEILELSKKFMDEAYILFTRKMKVEYKMFKLIDLIEETNNQIFFQQKYLILLIYS